MDRITVPSPLRVSTLPGSGIIGSLNITGAINRFLPDEKRRRSRSHSGVDLKSRSFPEKLNADGGA